MARRATHRDGERRWTATRPLVRSQAQNARAGARRGALPRLDRGLLPAVQGRGPNLAQEPEVDQEPWRGFLLPALHGDEGAARDERVGQRDRDASEQPRRPRSLRQHGRTRRKRHHPARANRRTDLRVLRRRKTQRVLRAGLWMPPLPNGGPGGRTLIGTAIALPMVLGGPYE